MEIKENENEMELSKEDLKKFIITTLDSSQTIDEAIKEKREEVKSMRESFHITKKSCSNIINYSNSTIIKMNIAILQINLLKLLSYIILNEQEDLLNDIIIKIQNVIKDIKIQNVLLKEIRKAILKLEKNKTACCNMEICKLIAYIYSKEQFIMDELVNYINTCKLNVEGIKYQGTTKNQEKLTELDINIDNSIKSLGLRK